MMRGSWWGEGEREWTGDDQSSLMRATEEASLAQSLRVCWVDERQSTTTTTIDELAGTSATSRGSYTHVMSLTTCFPVKS